MKNKEFYILALSQKNVRLLQCTLHDIKEIDVSNIISKYSDMAKDFKLEKQLQGHSSGTEGFEGKKSNVFFHGHGEETNFHKDTLLHFFHLVNKEIGEILPDKNLPMILASVDYLVPIYKKANKYSHLLEDSIKGNPDKLNINSLHEKALPIAIAYFNNLERELSI